LPEKGFVTFLWWWVRIEIFWLGSGRAISLLLGSGQVRSATPGSGKFPPKILNFSIFFTSDEKKYYRIVSKPSRHLIYCGSEVCSSLLFANCWRKPSIPKRWHFFVQASYFWATFPDGKRRNSNGKKGREAQQLWQSQREML